MPYAIEMYFNAASESRILRLWDELADIGASSMRESGARPHVSLAVSQSVQMPATLQLLDRFAAETPSFPIVLSSLGLFATPEPVAFLAPKVTPELLSLHLRFFEEFAAISEAYWPPYSPAQWVPHCTLASRFPTHQLEHILGISRTAGLPLTCTVSEIGLVEFRPVRHLHVTPLANP